MLFDKVKIHCSSLGVLFVEPKDAAAKKAGELSATAKAHLYKIYIKEYWGRNRQLTTKQTDKGTVCEPASIELVSLLDDIYYEKNDEQKENDYIIGTPDIVTDTEIHDVKSSWDAETFMPMVIEPLEKIYKYQMQGYLWLWNLDTALVKRCLVNTTDHIIQNEKRSLLYKLNVISDESPEYKIAASELEYNMMFDDIPPEERVITHEVKRNEEIISMIPAKVEKAREFLKYLHEKHISLNKKALLNYK